MIDLQELFGASSSKYIIEEDIYTQYIKQKKLIMQKINTTNVTIEMVKFNNKNDKLLEQWVINNLKFKIK